MSASESSQQSHRPPPPLFHPVYSFSHCLALTDLPGQWSPQTESSIVGDVHQKLVHGVQRAIVVQGYG